MYRQLSGYAGEVKLIGAIISTVQQVIESLKKPGDGLAQRAISGGFWVFSLRVVQQLFSLGRLFILARILSPNDFGLMGVALLAMATLETFSQTGFQTALIQKRENIESYLDSAWTFLIIRGFALFAILYMIAPYAAAFFGTPEAGPIIQVIGVSVLLQAFTNIGVLYFQKELEFNRQFLYQFAGTLADFIVAVSAVLILQNVWALVFGLIAGNAMRCIVSYAVHPYRPHIDLDIRKARELFGFGKWILGSGILVFLVTQGDDILVGKLVGVTALGFYQMAYKISNMPATEVTHVISQVMFPVYSKLQQNRSKLKDAYLQTLKLTAFVSFFVTGIIFVLAPDFTLLFLGEKWMPMVPAIQVLVFAGLIRSIAATAGSVFIAIGKPKIDTRLQVVRLLVLAICIFPFIAMWGIVGASLAVLLSIFVSNIGFSISAIKITQCRVIDFAKTIVFPAAGVLLTIVSILGLMNLMDTGIWRLSVCSCVAVLEYFAIMYLFDNRFNYGIRSLITANLRAFKGV